MTYDIKARLARLEARTEGTGRGPYWVIPTIELDASLSEQEQDTIIEAAYVEQEQRLGITRPAAGVSAVVMVLDRQEYSERAQSTG